MKTDNFTHSKERHSVFLGPGLPLERTAPEGSAFTAHSLGTNGTVLMKQRHQSGNAKILPSLRFAIAPITVGVGFGLAVVATTCGPPEE